MQRQRIGRCIGVSGCGLGLAVILVGLLSAPLAPVMAGPSSSVRYVAPAGNCNGAAPCYSIIQAAIDAAGSGDEIRIAAGTYTQLNVRQRIDTAGGVVTQVVYLSKTVTLRGGYTPHDWSTADPVAHPTILDAQGKGRAVYITLSTISPTLENLQLTGGTAAGLGGTDEGNDGGGGLYVYAASATIRQCDIYSNTAPGYGGGVYAHYSNARLQANRIFNNSASDAGGGIFLNNHNSIVAGNSIFSNTAQWNGGGLYVLVGSPLLRSNIITGNRAALYDGGGLHLTNSAAALQENYIAANFAQRAGGGVSMQGGAVKAQGNDILENRAMQWGGGVYVRLDSTATFTRNLIFSNAAANGGGVYIEASAPTLDGNVIRSNRATLGGGAYVYGSTAYLPNNVIVDNVITDKGSGLYIVGSNLRLPQATIARNAGGDGSGLFVTRDAAFSSTVALTNSIIVSQGVGITVTSDNTVTLYGYLYYDLGAFSGGGGSLLTVNPYYAPPRFTADGYHLSSASPAIDAGFTDTGTPIDVDGQQRSAAPDYGADEYWPGVYLPFVSRSS